MDKTITEKFEFLNNQFALVSIDKGSCNDAFACQRHYT